MSRVSKWISKPKYRDTEYQKNVYSLLNLGGYPNDHYFTTIYVEILYRGWINIKCLEYKIYEGVYSKLHTITQSIDSALF